MDMQNLIQEALVAAITQECQTDIPEDDPARLDLVDAGNYQDDPEELNVVRVHINDPRNTQNTSVGSGWMDEKIEDEIGTTIGGQGWEMWYRRFTVQIVVWPTGKTQAEARAIKGTVVARVRNAINRCVLFDLADEFGEKIVVGHNPIRKAITDEGGGPDDEYTWKIWLYLQYLTQVKP